MSGGRAKSIRRNGGPPGESRGIGLQGEIPGFEALRVPNNGGAKSSKGRRDQGVKAVKACPEIENKLEDTAIGAADVSWQATSPAALTAARERMLTTGAPGAADVCFWPSEMLDPTTNEGRERVAALVGAAERVTA